LEEWKPSNLHKYISKFTIDQSITRIFCTANNCGDPGRPENGNTFGDGFSVGAVVNHTCNIGFALIGASERECLPSGNWSEPLPTCDGKPKFL